MEQTDLKDSYRKYKYKEVSMNEIQVALVFILIAECSLAWHFRSAILCLHVNQSTFSYRMSTPAWPSGFVVAVPLIILLVVSPKRVVLK